MSVELRNNEYWAVIHWRVEATREEIARITAKPEDLMRWWPAAFLVSKSTRDGDEHGVGAEFQCHVKGWLPHTLNFQGKVVEAVRGEKVAVEVWGDFEGRMQCDIRQEGAFCRIRFDWRVRVNKPFVRYLSPLFKIAFYSNHLWVMKRGWKSMQLELARRRSADAVAAPPGPTFPYGPRYRWLRKWLPGLGARTAAAAANNNAPGKLTQTGN